VFKGITFANPELLFLLVLIPLLAAWYFIRRKRNNTEIRISTTAGLRTAGKSVRVIVFQGTYVLRLLALTLLILALARPQTSLSRTDISVEGIDIVIALDVSGSMLAQDFRPDRLEAAKQTAMEFIDARPNDRIGLVIFSGEAFTQSPLTTDHAVIKNIFNDIQSGMIEDGTALGDGLATAVNRIRTSKAVSKVIILLTDGNNNMGAIDPMSAAEIAKLYGIRVYTVGIGTIGMAPYPVQTPFGIQLQSMKVDIDEPLLRKISEMTDGKYFRATDNAKLRQIYKEIDKMEKSKIDVTEFKRKNEKYIPFVLLALGLLLLEWILRFTYLRNIP
jgi:Ca-activated chloride channel homolog